MKSYKYYITLLSIVSLFSCQDEYLQEIIPTTTDLVESRAVYDNYVEWDNTSTLNYKYGSEVIKTLTVPWAAGQAQSAGLPSDWFDSNLNSSNPKQRIYSHANGWEMVYSNLLTSDQNRKYFALYNKYTGVMRFFFYEIASSSGSNSSSSFIGVQVTNSSLLNFTHSDPQAMDYRPTATSYIYAPRCDFASAMQSAPIGGLYPLPGIPYQYGNWYGMEFECAYDDSTPQGSKMNLKFWAENVYLTQTEGEAIGDIVGNISTTYSNSPSFDIKLNFNNTPSTTVVQSINNSGTILGDKIEEEVNKNNSFFTGLWNKLKTEVPSIASQGVKAGINSLLTGGASKLVSVAGKLLNSALGIGNNQTMTSLSEVKLKTNATITLTSTTSNPIAGWGNIKELPIPGTATSALYNEKLGVWNISTTPTVKVDLYSTSYFDSSSSIPMAINPNKIPYEWETEYQINLQPIEIKINPIVLEDFTLQNVHKELVFTSQVTNLTGSKSPYGLYNDIPLYTWQSTNNITVKEYNPSIQLNGYNPNTSFNRPWENEISSLNGELYCRIYFELKHKTTNEIIGHSKYFKVNAIKGNHTHRDLVL